MKLKKIPTHEVKVPGTRVTAVYDEETAALLKQSLETAGTINPIIVVQDGEEYIVVDGLHRLQEAQERHEAQIEAVIYEGDGKDALLMNLILNKVRGKTKVSEMVEVIGSLHKDHLLNIEDIEEKTGLPRNYIEKLVKIAQASPAVQQALDQEIIGVGHAYELSRLPYAIQQEELIAKHQVYRLTVKDLHDTVDAVLKEMELMKDEAPPAPPGAPPVPREYHCEGCKEIVDPRYLRPVMLCPNCFGEVWRLAKMRESVPETSNDKGAGA